MYWFVSFNVFVTKMRNLMLQMPGLHRPCGYRGSYHWGRRHGGSVLFGGRWCLYLYGHVNGNLIHLFLLITLHLFL